MPKYWASQVAQWVKNLPTTQETQEMQVWSLGQEDPLEEEMATHSSKIDHGEKTQMAKVSNERGDITNNSEESKRTLKEYYEQLYANKSANLWNGKISRKDINYEN